MRKCGFCKGPHPVSDHVVEESPFCAGCLHKRVALRAMLPEGALEALDKRVEFNPKDTFLAYQDTMASLPFLGIGLLQLLTPEDNSDPWFGMVGISLAILLVPCLRTYRMMSRVEVRLPSREWIKARDFGPGAAPFGCLIGAFIRAWTTNNWQPIPLRLGIILAMLFLVVFFARRDRLTKGIIIHT